MAKASLGKLDTRQPVAVDLTKVRDVSARLNTPAALPQMNADFITPINVPQPKSWRPSALAVLDGVLGGGMTFTESRRAEEDRHRAELAMPQMEALKTRLLTELGKAGPDELKAYLTNPGEYGKNVATRLAASDLAAGSSRVFGNPDQGGNVYTAPKTDTAAGQAFSYGPEGVKPLGAVPFVPEYVNVGEGGKAVPRTPILPPGFGGPASIAASLPQIGEERPPAPVAARSGQPRSVRNNNPGNLEDGPFTRSQPGYKGSDGRFAIFESPDAGHAAQVALLGSYGKRGINTVEAIINRWAPPTENDTGGYVNFVAQKAGVKPGDPIDMSDPEILGRVADAIRIFEGGPQSRSNGPVAVAGAPQRAGPTGGDPAGTIYGREKAQPRPMTPEERVTWKIPEGVPAVMKADGTPDVISLPGGQSSPRKAEADLRKEFNLRPEVKEFRDVSNSYRVIQRLAGQDTAAGDMSMIFAFMKMLDPGSVVREGEFANAQNSAGIPDRVVNAYNKALSGTRLAPKQRADFLGQARNIFDTRSDRFGQIAQEYRGYAADYDLDPDRITTLGEPEPAPGPAREKGWSKALPAPQVEAAKKFKGAKAPAGDPTNPFVPRNAAEFKNIPSGKSYVDDDGSVLVKR